MSWETEAKKSNGGEGGFVKAPPGNHRAVLVALIQMGNQWQEPFEKGKKGFFQERNMWVWELSDEPISGTGKNHLIGIDLTFSLHEKAKMRAWIEARAGKKIPDGAAYDITKELGQPCLLNVIMKGDFPKVEAMSGLPKSMPKPEPTYPLTLISLEELKAKKKLIPEWVPWWYGEHLADIINRCKEFGGTGKRDGERPERSSAPADRTAPGPEYTPAAEDSEIPF